MSQFKVISLERREGFSPSSVMSMEFDNDLKRDIAVVLLGMGQPETRNSFNQFFKIKSKEKQRNLLLKFAWRLDQEEKSSRLFYELLDLLKKRHLTLRCR